MTAECAYIKQALLGVKEFDIYRDYELSMMAQTGKDPNNPNSAASYMVRSPFTALYNYIKDYQPKKTMQENAEAFVRSIGITDKEIFAIKANMLERVQ